MVEETDHDFLLELFERRSRVAADPAAEAYFAGWIDGHCLQNAITHAEVVHVAADGGYTVDWVSALETAAV